MRVLGNEFALEGALQDALPKTGMAIVDPENWTTS
jgi:hypothetical protein